MKTAKPPLPGGRLLCPKFWALFCENFLCIERRLGIEIWKAIYPSAELLFQLAKIEDSGAILRRSNALPSCCHRPSC